MKKIATLLAICSVIMLLPSTSNAQAWERHSKVLSIGFGASEYFHLDNYYYYPDGVVYRNWYAPITGQFNFQGEFGVHRYVGLGFTTGIGGRGGYYYGYNGEFNIPLGLIVNFHFYQLIADKRGKDIHADKLDIYAGANIGSGVAAVLYPTVTRIVPLAFGGPHVGVRYYFAPKVGVNGELGFGKSIINVGFSFKL